MVKGRSIRTVYGKGSLVLKTLVLLTYSLSVVQRKVVKAAREEEGEVVMVRKEAVEKRNLWKWIKTVIKTVLKTRIVAMKIKFNTKFLSPSLIS